MNLETTRFGTLHVLEDEVIVFPEGLVGFKENKKYVIVPHGENSPFSWMQSIEKGHLAYIVIEPQVFCHDYEVKISREELAVIELTDVAQAKIYVIVVVGERPEEMTANLLGPLVLNREKNLGKQLVLNTEKYHTRHKIMDELKRLGG